MRVWWLEKLPAQRASFVWKFIPRQTKTVSSILLETNFISAVPLKLTFRSAFFVYQHIRRSLNDCGSRQSILKFRTALESPFHFQCNTAIPPPAALCENTIENVLLFLNGFSLFSILYLTTVKKSIPSLKFFPISSCSTSGKHPRRDFANGAGKLRLYIITVHTPPALFQTAGLRRTSPARCRL